MIAAAGRCRPALRLAPAHLTNEGIPIRARHADIREQHVRTRRLEMPERLVHGRRRLHTRAGCRQDRGDQLAGILFVVDHEGATAAERDRLVGLAIRSRASARRCSPDVSTRVRIHSRQLDGERRTLPQPLTLRAYRAAVKFHQVSNDGQAESEASMLTADRAICLAKTFKHIREKSRIDAGAVILDTDPTAPWSPTSTSSTSTSPPAWVNLTALANRFQTICCSRCGSPSVIRAEAARRERIRIFFASAAGRTASKRRADDGAEIDRLQVESQAARR